MKSTTSCNLEDNSSVKPPFFSSFAQHLLTCELDGHLLKTVEDCVAKLRRLEAKGRLWPQNMIMDVQGPFLVLSDIETKVGFWSTDRFYLLSLISLSAGIELQGVHCHQHLELTQKRPSVFPLFILFLQLFLIFFSHNPGGEYISIIA